MRENISIYTRLRTVVTCTNRNVCNNIFLNISQLPATKPSSKNMPVSRKETR